METRISPFKVAPKAYQAMNALQAYVESAGLDRLMMELVKIRASQINGCAYCLDLHTKDARALGETEQRIYLLSAWRERAALEWTEALTLITEGHVPDEIYERALKQFQPEELVNLSVAIATINSWNRMSIAFRGVPGPYKSKLEPLKAKT